MAATTVIRAFGSILQLGREAARMVLPSRCVVCAGELPWRARVGSCCDRCWAALPRIDGAQCRRCAIPLPGEAGDSLACIVCAAGEPALDWCAAWGTYDRGLERLLHAFKFERHDFLARPLGELLADRLGEESQSFEVLTAIPMTRARIRQRGYNQAVLLARELGAVAALPFEAGLLLRRKETATQSTLPRRARAENVREAFSAAASCRGRAVLVVDDISTTGETLRAAAAELKRCGASRVGAIIVARVGDSHQ
jgi:ComF family protein